MSWSDGRLTEASIDASVDGLCRVSAEGLRAVLLDGKAVSLTHETEGRVEFEARAGSVYRLTFATK